MAAAPTMAQSASFGTASQAAFVQLDEHIAVPLLSLPAILKKELAPRLPQRPLRTPAGSSPAACDPCAGALRRRLRPAQARGGAGPLFRFDHSYHK
jgi:hypothetical protein